MELPAVFVKNITQAFPAQGTAWLQALPTLLQEACQRWSLTPGEPMLLSYNYVCAVTRSDDTPAILKLGVPNPELTSEIAALRFYAGKGACRLYDADAERGMLLLERLQPGTMLHEHGTDDQQTRIAAQVMRRLWRPASSQEGLLTLRGWFDALSELRPRFAGGTGPFPRALVEAAESLLPALLADSSGQVLLHGDCHHFNILSSARGWLAIDPKGVIGPREYEPAPLLLNPWDALLRHPDPKALSARRIHLLAQELGCDPQRLLDWGICHCLLSAWWDLQDDGHGGEYPMTIGKMLLELRL